MNVWVYKVNTRRGWEFDEYFRSRTRGPKASRPEVWSVRGAALGGFYYPRAVLRCL